MLDAILFDNDGVLVDTEALYFQANREALAAVGVVLDEASYVELFLREGLGAWHLAEARGVSPAGIEELRAARDRRYFELLDRAPIVIPGVAELLPKLAGRFRLAIVTSSEPGPFARTHARTGLLPHFELVLTRADYQRVQARSRAVPDGGRAPRRSGRALPGDRGLRARPARRQGGRPRLLGGAVGLDRRGRLRRRRCRAPRSVCCRRAPAGQSLIGRQRPAARRKSVRFSRCCGRRSVGIVSGKFYANHLANLWSRLGQIPFRVTPRNSEIWPASVAKTADDVRRSSLVTKLSPDGCWHATRRWVLCAPNDHRSRRSRTTQLP